MRAEKIDAFQARQKGAFCGRAQRGSSKNQGEAKPKGAPDPGIPDAAQHLQDDGGNAAANEATAARQEKIDGSLTPYRLVGNSKS